MKFMAASVLPPARWGRKKEEEEDQYIHYLYIQQEYVAEWGAVMCVFVLSVKGSLVALQLEK